jgi:hypothetical protein
MDGHWPIFEKLKGEKLIGYEITENGEDDNQTIMTFEDSEKLDPEDTIQIIVTGGAIYVSQHMDKESSRDAEIGEVIGKRLLGYMDWHVDTMNVPILQLELGFEDRFVVHLAGYKTIRNSE